MLRTSLLQRPDPYTVSFRARSRRAAETRVAYPIPERAARLLLRNQNLANAQVPPIGRRRGVVDRDERAVERRRIRLPLHPERIVDGAEVLTYERLSGADGASRRGIPVVADTEYPRVRARRRQRCRRPSAGPVAGAGRADCAGSIRAGRVRAGKRDNGDLPGCGLRERRADGDVTQR